MADAATAVATRTPTRRALTERLSRLKPAKIRAIDLAGEKHEIAISKTARDRWNRMFQVLDGLDWEAFEVLDAQGAILARERNPDVSELAQVDEEEPEPGGPFAGLDRILDRMLDAQDKALARHEKQSALVLETCQTLTKMVTESMRVVNANWSVALKLAQSSAPDRGDDDYQPGDMSEQVISQAIAIAMPELVGSVMKKLTASPEKKNGAPKEAKDANPTTT